MIIVSKIILVEFYKQRNTANYLKDQRGLLILISVKLDILVSYHGA